MKILLVGESWVSASVHYKGFNQFSSAFYEEGHKALSDALRNSGIDVLHIPSHAVATEFPETVGELDRFDVIIISDVGSDSFLLAPQTFIRGERMPDRLSVIRDWVRRGGGLLMIGGYLSFSGFNASARYWASQLADVLPVDMRRWDDRVEAPDGAFPEVALRRHPIVDGLPEEWPPMLGYNEVSAKPSADVIVGIRGDPLLAVWSHGDGRVAAFTSDCSPHWASPEFLNWTGYEQFWHQLTMWLGRD